MPRYGLLSLALAVSACGPSPREAAEGALDAVRASDSNQLRRWLHPRYADGRGGRDTTIAELEALGRRYARRTLAVSRLEIDRGASQRGGTLARADALADVKLSLSGGGPSVQVEGLMSMELMSDQGFRVRSGLFTELRDVLEVMARRRAALEANDLEAYGAVLHPTYRDGDYDRVRLLERLAEDVSGAAIRLEPTAYRVELRPDLVHVDEHHRLRVDGQELPAGVGRFTLRRSAGRLLIQAGIRPPDR